LYELTKEKSGPLTPLRQRCFYPLAIEQVPGAGVLLLDETNFYRLRLGYPEQTFKISLSQGQLGKKLLPQQFPESWCTLT
jgi:hypothetical protein